MHTKLHHDRLKYSDSAMDITLTIRVAAYSIGVIDERIYHIRY
jgi:hypothetical protein